MKSLLLNNLLMFLVSSGIIWMALHTCFPEISNYEANESDLNDDEDKLTKKPERKVVAILFKNNVLKMVYVDNDYIVDDVENENYYKTVAPNNSADVTSTAQRSSYNESGSIVAENPWNIEWDETIDYDYEKLSSIQYNRLADVEIRPKNQIVLVQERRYCNNPVTNVLYRYGDAKRLAFALPKKSTFQAYQPLKFHSSFVDTSLTFTSHANMLINIPYRYETVKRFMPKDAVLIAVLRDPVKSYCSKLIAHPLLRKYKHKTRLKFVKKLIHRRKSFKDKHTNSMASLFGFSKARNNRSLTSKEIIRELQMQFDLVLIGDYIDESLVVLKNFLNWSIADVVYTNRKKNVDGFGEILTEIKVAITKNKKADMAIYDHFNKTFWQRINSFGTAFTEDLSKLQNLNQRLTNYCTTKQHLKNFVGKNSETACDKLTWDDKEYVSYLKRTSRFLSDSDLNSALKHLKDSLDLYFNITRKEIQRYIEN